MDTFTRFLTSGFFHESVSPKHLSIPVRPFRIFSKIRGDIRGSRCTTGVNDTGGKWKKSSSRKILIILFGHLWVVELTYTYIFAFKFTIRCLQPDIVLIICHRCRWHRWQICCRCRWYRWQFATGVVDPCGKGELVAKFAAGVVDTGGKFAAGVVDTGGNLPPVSLTPVANLPPVSLTPVVHLDLRISPRIFEKIRIGPKGILWGWGETDS